MKRKARYLLASLLLLAVLVWLLFKLGQPRPGPQYRITDLGMTGETPRGLNNKGQIVGQREVASASGSVYTAYVWDSTQGFLDIQVPKPGFSVARAINDSGKVAGTIYDKNRIGHPFLWDQTNGAVLVGDIIGCGSSSAMLTHINERGHLLGELRGPDGKWRSFYWSEPTGMIRLSTPGSPSFYVGDLNDIGQVVGNLMIEPDVFQPKLWSATTGMQDLKIGNDGEVWVALMNNEGVVFGSMPLGQEIQIFEWTIEEGMTVIGSIPRTTEALIVDFNAHGDGVGGWRVRFGKPPLPRWQTICFEYFKKWFGVELPERWAILLENGVLHDLNDLIDPTAGWFLLEAMAINDYGQITGMGVKDGEKHAFLLTPVEN